MPPLTVVFLIIAIVCFALAALGVSTRLVGLTPLGLVFLAAAHLPV